MAVDFALVVVGLVVLLVAGDLLVRGAVGLAQALRIPALIVSLTIVAFGTSAPELVVTVKAVLEGVSGIAIGNIVGSNIANILLVLGFPALIYPISAHSPGLNFHAVFMLVATAAFAAAAYLTGAISASIGWAFVIGVVLYVGVTGWRARSGMDEAALDDVESYAEGENLSLTTLLFLAAGLIGLPLGANLLVTNGAALAADLGVRDELIGLTIIAFGTSLPELATVVAAAVRQKSDVAMGNIIGSNIFNILAVGGAAGVAGGAAFDAKSLALDLPVMIAVAVLIASFVLAKRDIGRITGALMAIAYIAFVVLLIGAAHGG